MAHPTNGNDSPTTAGSLTADSGAVMPCEGAPPGTRQHFTHMALALAVVPDLAAPAARPAAREGIGEAAFRAFEIAHYAQPADLPNVPVEVQSAMASFGRTGRLSQAFVDNSRSIRDASLATIAALRQFEGLLPEAGAPSVDLADHVRQVEAVMRSATLFAPVRVRGEADNDDDRAARSNGPGSPPS